MTDLLTSQLKQYTDLSSFGKVPNPVLTTGTFDGVHVGHKKIIKRLCDSAKEIGGETVLLTFYPHPRMVLYPNDHGLRLLNSPEEKAELLEKAGIDHLITIPFSQKFSRLKPIDYVRDILVNQLQISKMIVGYDHHYGRNREGNIHHLKEFSETYGFEVEEIPAQEIDEISVSSTKIRRAIEEGEIETASKYLGYDYSVSGKVIKGDGIGRTIGFPTANVEVGFEWKLIPGKGVYAVNCIIDDQVIPSMANLGQRPTVGSNGDMRLEVHLIDWEGDLYEKDVRIEFISFLREEEKFHSLEHLKNQLELDLIGAKKALTK